MKLTEKKTFISSLVEGTLDPNVYDDVLKFHARQSISIPKFGNVGLTTVDKAIIQNIEFSESEISPFRSQEINCDSKTSTPFNRQASYSRFSDKKIPLSYIKTFLNHSFSPDEDGHRPYPSAGGLYPIEPLVFLFNDKIDNEGQNFDCGYYHYRPVSQCLQFIHPLSSRYFVNNILHGLIDWQHRPAFAIFYVAHVGKAIFKYRTRGYRHAMMEAGSMYQHASYVSQTMNMRTTLWSSFSEPQILSACGLDQATFLAITMQLFGLGEQI